MQSTRNNLYPEIEPFHKNWLKVSDLHRIYYEECGNPAGSPVLFLHGGPGSGCNATQRRFFDPAHYRIILLDQRGCGRSTPLGEVINNTTEDLVADCEQLRLQLGIIKWHVFGGSWGSTLALAYATAHAEHIISLSLRGIFLSRQSELDWFLGGVAQFYPEVWQRLLDFIPPDEQDNILLAYQKRIFSDDHQVNSAAAITWNAFENAIMRLLPTAPNAQNSPKLAEELQKESAIELARARVQLHYIVNHCFIDGEQLLRQSKFLHTIPCTIVQGRYDMVCPPLSAWQLSLMMPHAHFVIVADAGHSAMELGVVDALVAATEHYKTLTS
jgi:proline iminopeptidase